MDTNETTNTGANPSDQPAFVPATDIYESPKAILLRCDMPGVANEDLEITLENKVLSVSGRQRGDVPQDAGGNTCEYLTGVYRRSFNINRDVDETGIAASLKNGVLEIELPKAREGQALKIPVGNG